MVDVLWKEGKPEAAIRLEILWNRLAQRYGFALLCGYSMGNFYKETKGFEAICREHTHVVAPLAEPAVARQTPRQLIPLPPPLAGLDVVESSGR